MQITLMVASQAALARMLWQSGRRPPLENLLLHDTSEALETGKDTLYDVQIDKDAQ
jgi:hypothetical protein